MARAHLVNLPSEVLANIAHFLLDDDLRQMEANDPNPRSNAGYWLMWRWEEGMAALASTL